MNHQVNANFIDHYKTLGVSPSAELGEIRRAYIVQAKLQHPDAGGLTQDMQKLNLAYKTLTDDSTKAAYDMLHSFHVGTTEPGDYTYNNGREVTDVTDMSDGEIDQFLDDLFNEYRDGPHANRQGVRQWFKKLFS